MADKCPVVIAIDRIYGSGEFDESRADSRLVVLGGNDAPHDHPHVRDEMTFHMTIMRLEFARFVLGRPTSADLVQWYDKHLAKYAAKTTQEIVAQFATNIDDDMRRQLIYAETALSDLLDEIRAVTASKSQCLNMSLPAIPRDLHRLPNIASADYPAALRLVINNLVAFCKKIRVVLSCGNLRNNNDGQQNSTKLIALHEFAATYDHSHRISKARAPTVIDIQAVLDDVSAAAEYTSKIEQYQSDAIRVLSACIDALSIHEKGS